MWTGPLHERSWLVEMAREAESRSWTGHSFEAGSGVKLTGCNPPQPLETLLQELIDESDPRLPPWIFHLREVAKVCERDIPARDKLVELLQERGYAACRSHVEV
jgi:tRNA (guanine26-N2/guanine27-N2)-dimethyltransferase